METYYHKNSTKTTAKKAFINSLPVMAGYICLGIGFGILLESNGYSFLWAILMSITIYAGSMQYVAVDLLTGGATLLAAALTTLMVNARHLFYGLSMLDKFKGTQRRFDIQGTTENGVKIVDVQRARVDKEAFVLGDKYHFEVTLDVATLSPADIGVELVVAKQMVGQQAPDVTLTEQLQLVNVEGTQAIYALDIAPNRTGAFDLALRVYPKNEKLPYRMDFALVKWA